MELKEALHEAGKRNMSRVSEMVALYLGIGHKGMLSKSRSRHLVDARRIVYNIIKSTYGYTLCFIGTHFKKNHATIIHNIRAHENLMKYDKNYAEHYTGALSFVLSGSNQNDEGIVLLQKKHYLENMLNTINSQIIEHEKNKHEKNSKKVAI